MSVPTKATADRSTNLSTMIPATTPPKPLSEAALGGPIQARVTGTLSSIGLGPETIPLLHKDRHSTAGVSSRLS